MSITHKLGTTAATAAALFMLTAPADAAYSGDISRTACAADAFVAYNYYSGGTVGTAESQYWYADDQCTLATNPSFFSNPMTPHYGGLSIPTERYSSATTFTGSAEVKGGNGTAFTQPQVCDNIMEFDSAGNFIGSTANKCTGSFSWYNHTHSISLQPFAVVVFAFSAQIGSGTTNVAKISTVSAAWRANGS